MVDQVILVVSAGQTGAESAARASELLERRGRPPLGVALIGARDVPNSSEYYYDDDDPYLESSTPAEAAHGPTRSETVIDLSPEVEVTAGG